jgi:hypothetical protein
MSASYGRNITTSDDASLSWSYKGGTNIIAMDAGLLQLMFPGLVIGLNNGGGNQYYAVNAVYPLSTIDGTHIGHVQVSGPLPGSVIIGDNGGFFQSQFATTVLAGTAGATPTTYTGTVINQQPFAWQQLSTVQPVGTPALSSCGTSPVLASGSTDAFGSFTTGTAAPTGCTLAFSSPFPANAICSVTPANTAANGVPGGTYISAQANTGFIVTLGTGTSSAKYNYTCQGN